MAETQFKMFQLKPFLIEALESRRFLKPTEIQERLIPSIQKGKSVIGQSQTGTGKTLAFLLPIIDRLDAAKNECQAVVTAPTRELADQIFQEALQLLPKEEHPYRIKKVVGGTDRKRMIQKLKTNPHMIVGTPGRIADLVKQGEMDIYPATTLVVDEADLMLDMGFIEEVDQIAARMSEHLQMLVFSATIPEKLQPFLKKYMDYPKFVQVKPEQAAAATIEHLLVPSRYRETGLLVVEIAKAIHPYLALIFANTKENVDIIYSTMLDGGLQVEKLHGGLTPRERKQAIKRIDRLECQYIVATDLASRGIDIKGVSHVIQAELPEDLDFYIHRSGRTGRAGASGISITIYRKEDENAIEKLEKKGIAFRRVEWKDGEWRDIKKRKNSKNQVNNKQASAVPKAKKIKPGYKKKLKIKKTNR